MRIIFFFTALAGTCACGLALAAAGCAGVHENNEERRSRHLEYSGYSRPEYPGFQKQSQYLTTRDGEQIAIDTFQPSLANGAGGAGADRSFPTILMITPYGRSLIMEDLNPLQQIGAYWKYGTSGPIFDATTRADVKLLLAHGYAVAVASMRGTGASTGTQIPFDPGLASDAEDTIAWIRGQAWSDGSLCMMGRSYRGWIQLMVAARKPAGLRCIVPEVIIFDAYTEGLRPGGIDALGWIEAYSRLLSGLNRGDLDRSQQLIPPAPVVDEDGDGELVDEIPVRNDAAPRSFFNDEAPQYADGESRRDIYYNAIKEHAGNLPFRYFRRENAPYRDSTSPETGDLKFARSNPGYYIPDIVDSEIAVYHVGGWFDGFLQGTTKLYATMEAAGQRQMKLQIAPRFHMPPYVSPAYADHLDYEGDYVQQLALEKLRFFDYHLKGIQNGVHDEEPVNVYVFNDGWRSAKHWPPRDAVVREYHLNAEQSLGERAEAEAAADRYQIRFDHTSSYGSNSANRWLLMHQPDTIMDRTAADRSTLIYETPPLARPTDVIGHPIVKLFLSSDQADGDVFVYLTEVTPDGASIYVGEGQLRAGWHRRHPGELQVDSRVKVLPDLPYHGFGSGQYDVAPFAGGRVIEMRFALTPVAYRFRTGHRIRIAVAGADNGNFEMNPHLCTGESPEDCPDTTLRIHRGGAFASSIELPIVSGAQR